MSDISEPTNGMTRRDFLRGAGRAALLLIAGGAAGFGVSRSAGKRRVWQIDPLKCVQCGQCATDCVLDESAVKCVHDFKMCGYCERCTGFFRPTVNELNEGAENQLCPTNAIRRVFVEEPYFEYTIDEKLCTGCGKCVRGCSDFGNGSLYLQVRHDRCLNCNECFIAARCPSGAFMRVDPDAPYVLKSQWKGRA
ncbi:MAG TPA: ferredoxin [Candidatus Brocadiia bacterium]|nr:ferredoxin [Candidatus Brocadiia bacterium]